MTKNLLVGYSDDADKLESRMPMSRSIRNLICLVILISLAFWAWFLQDHLLINGDISWDLLAVKRLLKGGSYTKDFFDLNPPLIFFEYIPSVLMEKLFSLSEITAFRLYVLMLSFVSLFFCSFFIKTIFPKKDVGLTYVFFITLAVTYFIFPIYEFGQREQFMLMFTMPYFLATVCRLQGNKLSIGRAFCVGIFAALGIGIKPYFILPLLLIELYYMFFTRNILSWLRVEILTTIFVLSSYLFIVYMFYSDYLFTVVPLASQFYYKGFSKEWMDVLWDKQAIFCYFSIVIYFFQIKYKEYRILKSVLFLVILSFLLIYFIQKINWYYHIYPAYAVSFLLSILMLGIFIKQMKNIIWVSLYGGGILGFVCVSLNLLYLDGQFQKSNSTSLIAFIKKHAENQPIYLITATVAVNFSAVTYANAKYASRFLHLFWMPAIIKQRIDGPTKTTEDSFTNMMAEDISTKKPKLIFVDVKDIKAHCSYYHFDYLPYFLENANFAAAWRPYHYYTTIEKDYPIQDQKKWNLYFFSNKKDINLAEIKDKSIVLTDNDIKNNIKTVYVVKNKKWLTENNKKVYTVVTLTADELNFLKPQSGFIKRTNQNTEILNEIMTKAIYFPIYKLQVYQRDATYDGVV